MKRVLLAGLLVAGLSLVSSAHAGLTPVYAGPNTLYEGAIGYTSGPTIMRNLYGLGNYTRVQDTGPVNDQVWGYQSTSLKAVVTAQARYAGDTSVFGVFQNPSTKHNMIDLGTISGLGLTATFSNVNTQYATNITANSFQIQGSGTAPPAIFQPFALAFRNVNSGVEYSSVQNLNIEPGGGIPDHMVTFLITGGPNKGAFVVAYEDTNTIACSTYIDAVIQLNGLTPVPEPTSFVIAGIGSLGFALRVWLSRKRTC
jgi:hypothetical protein